MHTKNFTNYIDTHFEQFQNELREFLKIPSISAIASYTEEVRRAANFLLNSFDQLHFDNKLFETDGHPIVFAQKIIDESKPTILIYGHYDVQPVDPISLWDHPPFEPTIIDDKIYARGASDDKGQVYLHLKAVEVLQQTIGLPCNVKFLIEGEEEVGSENLEAFLKSNKELLSSDVILVSDTSIISNDSPSITVGLRGLSYLEIEMTGPNRDLHSGVYGGAVGNPINLMCEMLSSLHDKNGKIAIPKFYEEVAALDATERDFLAKAPFNLESYKRELGIEDIVGEKEFSAREKTGIRPSLDINGIWGGYIEEGAKTVLPSKCYAKVSARLVPNQQHEKITQLITDYLHEIAPKSVKLKITPFHGGDPSIISTDSQGYLAASKAMHATWGKDPIPTREGGSIPIVSLFDSILNKETILMGFGLDSDAIHSPNEHFGLFNFKRGIETSAWFHHYFSEIKI